MNEQPDLESVCGHGFDICFSSECAKPKDWAQLMRSKHILVKDHYEAIKRVTSVRTQEVGEAYHKGLNEFSKELQIVRDERDTVTAEFIKLKLALQKAEGVLLEFMRKHDDNAYRAVDKTLYIIDEALAQLKELSEERK